MALTIAGFVVTFVQLRKTKSASEAVSNEISRIKLAVASYDAAQEASRALTALDSAKRHLRNSAWPDVADSYEIFRRSILTVLSLQSFDQSTIDSVSAASAYIVRLCERIEEGVVAGNVKIDPAKTISMMRQHDELASLISIHLQKGAIQ